MAVTVKKCAAVAILGTVIPAYTGRIVRGPFADGVLYDWLAGAAVLTVAASVRWAITELYEDSGQPA